MFYFVICVNCMLCKRNFGYFVKKKKNSLSNIFFFVVKNIYYVKLYYFMIFIARDSLKFTHV